MENLEPSGKITLHLLFDPEISLLGFYTKNTQANKGKYLYSKLLSVALLIVAKE